MSRKLTEPDKRNSKGKLAIIPLKLDTKHTAAAETCKSRALHTQSQESQGSIVFSVPDKLH
jgi:hypothetical protein